MNKLDDKLRLCVLKRLDSLIQTQRFDFTVAIMIHVSITGYDHFIKYDALLLVKLRSIVVIDICTRE